MRLSFLRLLWRALLPSFRLNEEQVCCEITSDLASLIILQLMMRKPVAREHKSKQSILFLEGAYVCLCVCIRVWGSLCRGKNWSWTSDREGGTDGKWNFIHAEKVPQGQLCSWIIVLYVFLPHTVSLSLSLHSVIMLSLLVQNRRSVYLGWRQSDKTVHGEGWSLQFFGGIFKVHLIPLLTHFLHLSFWVMKLFTRV